MSRLTFAVLHQKCDLDSPTNGRVICTGQKVARSTAWVISMQERSYSLSAGGDFGAFSLFSHQKVNVPDLGTRRKRLWSPNRLPMCLLLWQ
jgi:hypothetical protein